MRPVVCLLCSHWNSFSQAASYVVKDNALIPEGIAVNPSNGDIYVSSIARRKIGKITSKGEIADL